MTVPEVELDRRYSPPGASAVPWAEGERVLRDAEVFWISTVRPDGRPHVTPLLAVWHDGALHFCTGAVEVKAHNLRANDQVVLTTGANRYAEGLDVVLEGEAEPVRDDDRLRTLADAWVAKYGDDWRFDVCEGAFRSPSGDSHEVLVFAVTPARVMGYARGPGGSATRWRF
jgi:nitroimidazol reductase NimA-like FMN-containing flavoprotein (pyridoxamine 5'-phosphate oxidase superfamily)